MRKTKAMLINKKSGLLWRWYWKEKGESLQKSTNLEASRQGTPSLRIKAYTTISCLNLRTQWALKTLSISRTRTMITLNTRPYLKRQWITIKDFKPKNFIQTSSLPKSRRTQEEAAQPLTPLVTRRTTIHSLSPLSGSIIAKNWCQRHLTSQSRKQPLSFPKER